MKGRFMVIEVQCRRDSTRHPDLRQGKIASDGWMEIVGEDAAIAEANLLSIRNPDRTYLVLRMEAYADAISKGRGR